MADMTQQDLQREFYQARQNAVPHSLPSLPAHNHKLSPDLSGIRQALAATRHLFEMFRRTVPDEGRRCTLRRLDRRLLAVARQLDELAKL